MTSHSLVSRWVAAKWRRYLGKYGSKGVSKAVFISSVPPFLLKTPDNPEGVDGSVFEGIQKAVVADRYAFFTDFFKNFYNTDLLLGKRVSRASRPSQLEPCSRSIGHGQSRLRANLA